MNCGDTDQEGVRLQNLMLRVFVLVLSAVICGWNIGTLGYYLDDHHFLWILGPTTHPIIFSGGRFSTHIIYWALWKIFSDHLVLFHLFQLLIHLLVVNELYFLLRTLGIRDAFAAIGCLFFALFPVYYEAIYWLNALFYPLAALLFLWSIRLFLFHLRNASTSALIAAWICYFVACGVVELMWPLCISFVLVQMVFRYQPHRTRDSEQPVQTSWWKGLSFVGVCVLAVCLYLYWNRFSNRIEVQGGFAPLAEVLPNIVTMLRTTLSWPKRYFLSLSRESWADWNTDLSHQPWLFLVIVLVLVILLLIWLWRTKEPRAPTRWPVLILIVVVTLGLLWFLTPNLPAALVFPAFRSRNFYIPWLGMGLLAAVGLESASQHLNTKIGSRILGAFISGFVVAYTVLVSVTHMSIQDALRRGWVEQQLLYDQLKPRLSYADKSTEFFFVGDGRLIKTHLNLYILNNQLGCLDATISSAIGIRHPDLIHAQPVEISVLSSVDGVPQRLRLQTPRGLFVTERNLRDSASLRKVVCFGYESHKLFLYDRVRLVHLTSGRVEEVKLPASQSLGGPFRALELKY